MRQQIRSVLDDFPVRAIKTGMLFSAQIAASTADLLDQHPDIPLVLDPVMVATSGDALMEQDAVAMIIRRLFPRALLITPNLAEAAFLTGLSPARDRMEIEAQGRALVARGARAVLVKEGIRQNTRQPIGLSRRLARKVFLRPGSIRKIRTEPAARSRRPSRPISRRAKTSKPRSDWRRTI